MTDDNNNDHALALALDGLADCPLYIAAELRLMANAEPPYAQFADSSPVTRNIWRAASEILEKSFSKKGATIQ